MIVIKKDKPEGNVHCIIAALKRYKARLNSKNIQTTRIEAFLEQWQTYKYEEICKKVEELSHGAITIE